MRLLFRLISFAVLVLMVYFILSLNLSPEKQNEQDWIILKNQSGLELSFPTKPKQQLTRKTYPIIGASQLSSFQSSQDKELYVLLIVQDSKQDLTTLRLEALKDTVHQINDTKGLNIQSERQFTYQSFPAFEYLATRPDGVATWCRTIHTGKALLSLIYAHQKGHLAKQHRDRYFHSLQF